MKKAVIAILFCAVLAASVSASVVDLTPENFDQVVNDNKFTFVEFYAPWCGHCKSLAPEYEKFGAAFAGKSDVAIAKVDADANKDLGSRFGVSGYPTLKLFVDGKPEDYNGGRTAEDLIKYLNERVPTGSKAKVPAAGRSNVVVLTPDNFDEVVNDKSKHVLVEFYAPWCGHCKRLAPVWDTLSNVFSGDSDVVIAKVDADAHKELGSRFGVSGFPTIKYFPKNNKEGEEFDGGRELKDLVSWVNKKAGKWRTPEGRYEATVGVIKELTAVARDMFAGDLTAYEKAQEIYDTLAEKAKQASGVAGDVASDVYDKASDVAKDAAKVASDKASELYEDAKDAAPGMYEDAKEVASDVYDKAADVASDVYDKAAEKASELYDDAKEAAPGMYEDAKEVASDVYDKASDKAAELYEDAKDVASDVYDKASDKASELLKDAKKKAPGYAQEAKDMANDWATKIEGEAVKLYKRYLEVLKAGKDGLVTEYERVSRMLKGSLSPKKADEFSIRSNILSSIIHGFDKDEKDEL